MFRFLRLLPFLSQWSDFENNRLSLELRTNAMKFRTVSILRVIAIFLFCIALNIVIAYRSPFAAKQRTYRRRTSKSVRVYVTPNNSSTIAACAVPNVCMLKNEAFVPAKLREQESLLRKCFMYNTKFVYYEHNKPPAKLRDALHHRLDIDVLGRAYLDPYLVHFGHFAPQSAQMILPPASVFIPKLHVLNERCVSRVGSFEPCATLLLLRPRIVVGEIFLKIGWNRGFLHFLTKENRPMIEKRKLSSSFRAHDNTYPYLHMLNYDINAPPALCFRHALTSALIHNASVEWQDRWLRSKGVKRNVQLNTNQLCSPHVLLLLRENRKRVGRTIPKYLLDKLQLQLERHLSKAGLLPNIEVVTDLGLSRTFSQQMAVIQRADIVIAVHGAEFSNFLFLRNNAVVVELSPFGFFDQYFDRTIAMAGASVHRLCLEPDREEFGKCLRRNNQNSSEGFAEFENMGKRYKLDPKDSKNCRLTNQLGFDCTRHQRAFFDPSRVASIVAKHAQAMCNRGGT